VTVIWAMRTMHKRSIAKDRFLVVCAAQTMYQGVIAGSHGLSLPQQLLADFGTASGALGQ
jgi:hypothetical protein